MKSPWLLYGAGVVIGAAGVTLIMHRVGYGLAVIGIGMLVAALIRGVNSIQPR